MFANSAIIWSIVNRLEPSESPEDGNGEQPFMEIGDSGRGRRVRGLIAWLVLYLGIAAVLVLLFVRFTSSMLWAVLLVGFMLAYMTIVSKWAAGNIDRRE
jgi:hypothetical protein